MNAIPTMYRGVQFRSRLEARWAAYFDLRKIPWAYEPIELEGWIPDFEVKWGSTWYLVEVKPSHVIFIPDKVEASGYEGPLMLLGLDPESWWIGKWRGTAERIQSIEWWPEWVEAGNLTQWNPPGTCPKCAQREARKPKRESQKARLERESRRKVLDRRKG